MATSLLRPQVLVLMGVAGCGKSTVAAILAGQLGWPFEEGDALHPAANVEKMRAGHPLNDEDRAPWLARVADWVDAQRAAGQGGVITCSALKRAYRRQIDRQGEGVTFVYLAGSRELISDRLTARHGHFMPATLLDSQFAALEPPGPDEPAIQVDVGPPPGAIAQRIVDVLAARA